MSDLLRQIEVIKADGHAVCAGLSAAQLNWRPGAGRWSVAECLVHLNVSVTATFPAFDTAIDEGWARGWTGAGPFRYGWLAELFVRSMEPPPRWKMRTMPIFDAGAAGRVPAVHRGARPAAPVAGLASPQRPRVRRLASC